MKDSRWNDAYTCVHVYVGVSRLILQKDGAWSNPSIAAAALQKQYMMSFSLGPKEQRKRKKKVLTASRRPPPLGLSEHEDAPPVIPSMIERGGSSVSPAPPPVGVQSDGTSSPTGRRSWTIAERLGLIEGPPRPLTEHEWDDIAQKSRIRKDSHLPCPICHEPFGNKDQVLLSCSHVFHYACIRSYEQFAGKRCCPICRKQDYERRIIGEGADVFREECIVRIQSVWRGVLARRVAFRLRLEKDPELKRVYLVHRMEGISGRWASHVEKESSKLDSFFDELDRSVASAKLHYFTDIDWKRVVKDVNRRKAWSDDCPICMTSLLEDPERRGVCVTTCGHCFHDNCIASFEHFASEMMASREIAFPSCPVCRTAYKRRDVAHPRPS
jgi:hypothetical protein